MTGNEYQALAMRTRNNSLSPDDSLANGVMGLCGESGECADMVKKLFFQGRELDVSHFTKELGDVLWYIALCCESLGLHLNDVMQENVDKLSARYPNGFDPYRSQHRAEGDV